MEPTFDPAGYYDFDLSSGAVKLRSGARVLLLSDNVLGPLVSSAVSNGDLTAVRRLGKQLGEEAKVSLGESPGKLTSDVVLTHAATVVALFGFGKLSLERWGDALVARIHEAPLLDENELGIAALLGGLFSALAQRETACVPVGQSGFLVVDPGIAEEVWSWTQAGATLPTMIGRLEAS